MEKLSIEKSNTYTETKVNSVNIKDASNKPKLIHSPSVFREEDEDLRITGEKKMKWMTTYWNHRNHEDDKLTKP